MPQEGYRTACTWELDAELSAEAPSPWHSHRRTQVGWTAHACLVSIHSLYGNLLARTAEDLRLHSASILQDRTMATADAGLLR